jgi:parallel beta-helix repeat protein
MLAGKTNAAGYDFYVDANSDQTIENGSEQYPWKTITQATEYIKNHKLKKKNIFIAKGTYRESIAVSSHSNIFGEDKDGTIIDADGNSAGIYFTFTKSRIQNLTIKNAKNNLIIGSKSKVTVESCKIMDSAIMGVEVKKGSSRKSYAFTMTNSGIEGSRKYGTYISKRRISLRGNYVHDNKEEGIDLHDGIKGDIIGNSIEDNKESGIEAILAGTDLTIRGNDIKNNSKQGIAVQAYSSAKGNIKIRANTIRGNNEYGLRFANYFKLGPIKFKKFIDKHVKLHKNTIKDNGKGNFRYE